MQLAGYLDDGTGQQVDEPEARPSAPYVVASVASRQTPVSFALASHRMSPRTAQSNDERKWYGRKSLGWGRVHLSDGPRCLVGAGGVQAELPCEISRQYPAYFAVCGS